MSKSQDFSCFLCKNTNSDLIKLNSNNEFVCLHCDTEKPSTFCPSTKIENCLKIHENNSILSHVLKHHRNHVIESDKFEYYIKVNLNEQMDTFKLFVTRKYRFLLILHTDTTTFSYTLYSNTKHHDFTLEFLQNKQHIKRISTTALLGDLKTNVSEDDKQKHIDTLEITKTVANDNVLLHFQMLMPEQETLEKLVLAKIECPVCNQPMRRPIYQCTMGHSVCHSCKFKLANCPTCRSTIEVTRNYLVEDLISNVPFSCLYEHMGCGEVFIADRMAIHEARCEYRTYLCPINKEHVTEFSYEQLKMHFKEFHKEELCESDSYATSISSSGRSFLQQVYMFEFGLLFRLAYMHSRYQVFMFAVEIVGTHCILDEFVFDFSIGDSSKKLICMDNMCLCENGESGLEKRACKIPLSVVQGIVPSTSNARIEFKLKKRES